MENRLYAFDWKYIGDMELGRPNLGKTARLEIYRLFQYTLRDVLETEYGTEQSDRLLYKAGFLAGPHFRPGRGTEHHRQLRPILYRRIRTAQYLQFRRNP